MTHEFKTLCEAFEALAKKLDDRLTRMEMRLGLAIDNDTAPGHPELPLEAEAEDEADIRWAPADNRPTIAVEVGGDYYTRNGMPARVTEPRCELFHGAIHHDGKWNDYNWTADGSCISGNSLFDIVEAAPF